MNEKRVGGKWGNDALPVRRQSVRFRTRRYAHIGKAFLDVEPSQDLTPSHINIVPPQKKKGSNFSVETPTV